MTLRVHNSLTGRKEVVETRDPGGVSIYICGITPYSHTHLGHARPSVFWDTVVKYLNYQRYRVTTVQNVTDVNEKILTRALLEGLSEHELAEKYNQEYTEVMSALEVAPPDHNPWVSDHVDEIIALIERLVQDDYAYVSDGDVYFDVTAAPDYGQLSGQRLEDLIAGARVDINEKKRNPADFALWKATVGNMPDWPSPWGRGRPGWHIECSALSLRYLNYGFDFHGGGSDLVFPHHENERAQSEVLGDGAYARYWLHHGMITGEEGKMSKSLGNFVTVKELLKQFRPEVIRHFLLSAHYSSPLTFSETRMREVEKAWDRFVSGVTAIHRATLQEPEVDVMLAEQEAAVIESATQQLRDQFVLAMNDDFNTPRALASIFDALRLVNGIINAADFVVTDPMVDALMDMSDQLEISGEILGIWPFEGLEVEDDLLSEEIDQSELLNLLVEVRDFSREKKLWPVADLIRDRLLEMDIVLEDAPGGTRVKRGSSRES